MCMFQIFIRPFGMKAPAGDQMNTNLSMLHILLGLVHMHRHPQRNKNAQKFGKLLPH